MQQYLKAAAEREQEEKEAEVVQDGALGCSGPLQPVRGPPAAEPGGGPLLRVQHRRVSGLEPGCLLRIELGHREVLLCLGHALSRGIEAGAQVALLVGLRRMETDMDLIWKRIFTFTLDRTGGFLIPNPQEGRCPPFGLMMGVVFTMWLDRGMAKGSGNAVPVTDLTYGVKGDMCWGHV